MRTVTERFTKAPPCPPRRPPRGVATASGSTAPRRPRTLGLVVVAILVCLCAAAACSAATQVPMLAPLADKPLPPSQDPFYRPTLATSGSRVLPPGQLIATRPSHLKLVSTLLPGADASHLRSAYQISYVSTSLNGSSQPNVATVLVPPNQSTNPLKLLSWQTPEDSADIDCSPSYVWPKSGGGDATAGSDMLFINFALSKGWTVVVPDYEGPDSAFTVGQLAAHGVLDAIRATLSFEAAVPRGSASSARIAMTGYSGGALASVWAAQQMSVYAPELVSRSVGVAGGGLPVSVESILMKINGGGFSGLAVSGLVGQTQARPELRDYLESVLTKEGGEAVGAAKSQCSGPTTVQLSFKDIFASYFNASKQDVLANPAVRDAFAQSKLGAPESPVPPMPMYLFQATNDEVVSAPDTDKYVDDMCARGVSIDYDREMVAAHLALDVVGYWRALAWLTKRLDGVPNRLRGECRKRTVITSALDLDSIGEMLSGSVTNLFSFLGL